MADYVEDLKRKVLGALGYNVSAATSLTTAFADAQTSIDSLESKVFTVAIPDTTNGTTPVQFGGVSTLGAGLGCVVVPFAARLNEADMLVYTGAVAASQTNYPTFQLRYTPGDNPAASYTIATFAPTTQAVTTFTKYSMTPVAGSTLLTSGAILGVSVGKTGTGATTGVGTLTFVLNRRNES